MLKKIIQGIAIGVANIIPGVSGGTMMVSMGIYDKLIHAVTHLRKEFKKSVAFLAPIFLGVGVGVLGLAILLEYLLAHYPIPTNFAFCGLIAGSLPFILKNVKGVKVSIGKCSCLVVFFAIVLVMALLGETSGGVATVGINVGDMAVMFAVGVIAAATMVVPGVSGSMILMLLGYYETVLGLITGLKDALLAGDMEAMLEIVGILIPFGIGVVVGIFGIAKLIEFLLIKARAHVFYAIIGLIVASPIAILCNTDWSGLNIWMILASVVTFGLGWFAASKLGEE